MIKRTKRRGNVAVELLLLTPIVIGLIVAVLEIGMMTAANEQMAGASREGCRVAALGGGPDEIRRAVWNHLGQGNLSSAQITAVITENNNGPIIVALTDNNGQPIYQTVGNVGYNSDNDNNNGGGFGNSNGNDNNNGNGNNNTWPIPCGDPVLVRVTTPTLNAVPDLLAILGVSIQNSTLVGQTIMRKE
jgi:Flp pilus assembly protein TadG